MRLQGGAAVLSVMLVVQTVQTAYAQDVPSIDAIGVPGISNPFVEGAPEGGLTSRNSTAGAAKKLGYTADPFAGSPPLLLAPGIGLTLNYTSESAGLVSGGLRSGDAYAGQVFVGLDFDLAKITGADADEGTIHFAVTQRHGKNLAADNIGNNTSVQEIYGTQNLHLALLTYEKKFLDDKLDIEVGRTVANVAFLGSPIYCNFQSNATCGNPTFVFKDSNFTYFPAVSWGGHARYNFTDKIFLHVGTYEVNPYDKRPNDHGFSFGVDQATGVIIPVELGYATTFANDYLPRHYILGGWYDASAYTDPFLNTAGAPALAGAAALPYATHSGRSAVYGRFDQMIWREDPDSPRGLTVFGVAMANTSGRVQEDFFVEGGLLQLGTLPGRDADTIGLLFTDQIFSRLFLDNIATARGFGNVPRHEIMMELNYGLQVNPYVRVMPNLQYIINPDQTNEPFQKFNIPDAFVIGGKLSVDISSFMSYAMLH